MKGEMFSTILDKDGHFYNMFITRYIQPYFILRMTEL